MKRLVSRLLIILSSLSLSGVSLALESTEILSTSPQVDDTDEVELGIPVGEVLFLSLKLDSLILGDLIAYKSKQQAQLGLTSLFELADFPIEVDVDGVSATGWFINEDNEFTLARLPDNRLRIEVNGIEHFVAAEHYLFDDDIYVEASELGKWFDFSFDFDLLLMETELVSQKKLPVQLRLDRQQRKSGYTNPAKSLPVLPWKESHYQVFSTPVIDAQLAYSTAKSSDNLVSYSLVGSHDLAYFGSRYFLSGNNTRGLSDLRLTMYQESTSESLLGPLNATYYEFGDVTPVSYGKSSSRNLGKGFLVNNKLINSVTNNETIDFIGDIQPGWDVELYRNSILIDSQFSLTSGRYQFLDVDLLFGDNKFELIFYGPQGQVKTESKQIFIDGNATKQGQFIYDVSLTDVGDPLSSSSIFNRDDLTGWQLAGRYDYGFTDWFSGYVGHSFIFDQARSRDDRLITQEPESDISLGANFTFFDQLLINANYQFDEQDQKTTYINARTQINDHSFKLTYRNNQNVVQAAGQEVKKESDSLEFRMSGGLYSGSGFRVNYQNDWRVSETNSTKSQRITNALSLYTGNFSMNSNVYWSDSETALGSLETSGGSMSMQKNFSGFFTRFNVGYLIKPETEIELLSSEFSWNFTNEISAQLDLQHFPLLNRDVGRFNLNWRQDNFNLNSNFSYDDSDNWRLGISSNFSFGYNPEKDIYFLNKSKLGSGGSLLVRVFEDDNLNGKFDPGEPVVEGAKVKGIHNFRQDATNEFGLAMLSAMPVNKASDIKLDMASIDDPYLIPISEGISITPRKGFIDMLEIPLVQSSELEGTVFVKYADGTEDVASYAELELLDESGKVVATTQSEFDGFYLFIEVKPGKHTLRIKPDYVQRKRLKLPAAKEITFSGKGDVVNGVDFVLEAKQKHQGFVAKTATFSSLTILKAYSRNITKRFNKTLTERIFYVKDNNKSQYHLMLAFNKEKSATESYCQQVISALKLTCEVKPYSIEI